VERDSLGEVVLGRALIGFTLVACLLVGRDLFGVLAGVWQTGHPLRVAEQAVFIAIVYLLIYGNLVYQFARLGHLTRKRRHRAESREELARTRGCAPPLTILVPSYREEISVVRQTLLSAALQDHPAKRVVLLIDDPPAPIDARARAALRAARDLPAEIRGCLEKPARRTEDALAAFDERVREEELDLVEESRLVAALHAEIAAWFEERANEEPVAGHSDRFFAELVFGRCARAHRGLAASFAARLAKGDPADAAELRSELEALAARFRVEITSFERKRFVNLPHAPNKAMNLNAYIGLLGGRWREVRREDGLHLVPGTGEAADLVVPDAEHLITLDADSLLDPSYALRLAHFLMQPCNERVAVVQTPYSAFPGASQPLEHVAGATTDLQYVAHQGFTRWGATYWVGANAMLRKRALLEIRQVEFERGHPVARFIHDRTVIEDTESSIDLVARGWTLHNVPERLAWSATPADFGALLIQRRRWANGGLLILPRLLGYLVRGPWRPARIGEALMRAHYLVSIAAANVGLLMLLAYPFEEPARQSWIAATAIPYYLVYGRDLIRAGYRGTDLLRVYALNLLLLPVNLGGVLQSLRQAWTGRKSAFARTPKIASRTATPPVYLISLYALLAMLAVNLVLDVARARWLHGSFLLLNGGMLLYAFARFVGFRASLDDLRLQLGRRRRILPRAAEAQQ
jgi:cellulose synthase/poly-beta-1,6-N-acetylglucosamine synthase-like glycosyltransferase